MASSNETSAIKIVSFGEETILLAKYDKPFPKGDYEVKVVVSPVGDAPGGPSCGLCCQVLSNK